MYELAANRIDKFTDDPVELIGRVHFVRLRYGAAPNSSIQQHG
jgi:hypothetical protein